MTLFFYSCHLYGIKENALKSHPSFHFDSEPDMTLSLFQIGHHL